MNMFVVTAGTYSDYRLCGVYSTRDKALGVLDAFVDSRIEELPIDQELPQGKFWEVWMTRHGETGPCDFRQVNYNKKHKPIVQCAGGGFLIYVFGDDIQHAAKVANELRIQWLKENSA